MPAILGMIVFIVLFAFWVRADKNATDLFVPALISGLIAAVSALILEALIG